MKYGNEGMDCKKYFLLFLQKAWIALLAAAIGALLGGGIYLFIHVGISSNREYQAESELYLDYAPDESGEIYQEYNGYTWNDLMSTNLILDTTMSYLPDTYTEEEVVKATSAQILSDLRLLIITITTPSPDRTAEILKATDRSLEELGEREKEFIDIEIIKETEPRMLAADPRLPQAVLVGFILAFVLALLAMALIYTLNDKIYVPGDLRGVTQLPFVGFCFSDVKVMDSTERMNNIEKADRMTKTAGKNRASREQMLLLALQTDLKQNQAYLTEKLETLATLEIGKDDSLRDKNYEELRKKDGILLAVPYGKMDRATLSYRIEQLTVQDCKPAGILIKDADMRFMKWYYNHL